MDLRRVNDWCTLSGGRVEIRQQGALICSGTVDAVTEDGRILWIRPPGDNRRLYEKAEFCEVWATEDRLGFHYRVSLPEMQQDQASV